MEKAVQDIRHGMWFGTPSLKSMHELNQWLEHRCLGLWQENAHPEFSARSLSGCLEDQRHQMMPVPFAFEVFVEYSKRVFAICLINPEHNHYRVPASFANRVISSREYPRRLVIVAEVQVVVEHVREFNRDKHLGGTVYDSGRYLSVVERKPVLSAMAHPA